MLSALWDLLFPPRCLFCGERLEADTILCTHCRGQVLEVSRCCPLCGYPVVKQSEGECPRCNGQKFMFDRACAVGLYEGKLKAVIRRYKYGGRTKWRRLEKLMAQQIEKCKWRSFCSGPCTFASPETTAALFDRAVPLRKQSASGKVPVKALQRDETMSQTTVCRRARHNLAGALLLWCRRNKYQVLLVDDLLTTGFADNAARALRRRCGRIYLAVIGRSLPS